jgi:C4-dicarboxylate-specific signal transduction histidine kinase
LDLSRSLSRSEGPVHYAVSLLSVAAALALTRWLDLLGAAPVSTFICAVMVSAWLGGFGPGLLAIVISLFAFKYYFVEPVGSFAVDRAEIPRLAVFALTAFFVGCLSASQRRATKVAVRAEQFEKALREAESKLAHVTRVTTLGEVTASVAHEVNQPLAAIANNANACLGLLPTGDGALDEIREALGDIVADAERASAIIRRIRGVATRSASKRTEVRLADVVADVVALAAADAAARGVAICTELADDLPVVAGDRVELQQVLLNLLVNGMDAMASTDERQRVLVISGRADRRDEKLAAIISVHDHGTGLNEAQRERLFEAFYTTKPHGMGMGLAISRSIIETHGGRLWAEPNDGTGATFSFSVPAATSDVVTDG